MAQRRQAAIRRFGQEIARVRELKGLTQEDLAQAVGVDRVTVARWEGGARAVGGKYLAELEEALGMRLAFVEADDSGDDSGCAL